jgi:hypothetical protein
MIVGTLKVRLALRDCHSLKEKRRVLNSLKERLANTFNVSVAETDYQDVWQSAELGMATVGNETPFVDGALQKVMNFIRAFPPVTVVDVEHETFGD